MVHLEQQEILVRVEFKVSQEQQELLVELVALVRRDRVDQQVLRDKLDWPEQQDLQARLEQLVSVVQLEPLVIREP